jgi:hypothetical protein
MPAHVCAVKHENFFIAKNRDSESARARFYALKRLTITVAAHRARRATIEEMAAAQGFPVILTNADVGCSGVSRISISTHCIDIEDGAVCALTSLRQHFLKWDAVFFDVLVYSGWSVSRFPSARSELSHLTTSGGQRG